MFIRTPRLLLRPPWPEDAAPLAACLADGSIARRAAAIPYPYSLDDARAFIAWCEDEGAPRPVFAILAREAQGEHGPDVAVDAAGLPFAGAIGLTRDEATGAWELGYWIARPFEGRGYATEAAAHVLELAFLGLRLKRVTASHFLDNPASARVLAKLGFLEAGRTRRWCPARNCDVDCRNVALTREVWLAHRAGQVEMHAA